MQQFLIKKVIVESFKARLFGLIILGLELGVTYELNSNRWLASSPLCHSDCLLKEGTSMIWFSRVARMPGSLLRFTLSKSITPILTSFITHHSFLCPFGKS